MNVQFHASTHQSCNAGSYSSDCLSVQHVAPPLVTLGPATLTDEIHQLNGRRDPTRQGWQKQRVGHEGERHATEALGAAKNAIQIGSPVHATKA